MRALYAQLKEASSAGDFETPEFRSEKEEAEWWDSDEGRAAILKGFQDAQRDGTFRRGTFKNRAALHRRRPYGSTVETLSWPKSRRKSEA